MHRESVDTVILLALLPLLSCAAEGPVSMCLPGSLSLGCPRRCERNSECVAPETCDRATQLCVARPSECVPGLLPGGGMEGEVPSPSGCPENRECDPITATCLPRAQGPCQGDAECRVGEVCRGGRCGPDPGAQSCTRDAECQAPSVCRLIAGASGGLVRVCGPPVGPGEPGRRCLANTECQGGICLYAGVCQGGCQPETLMSDCGGHEDVICGRVLIASGGAYLPVVSCTLKISPCRRDAECGLTGSMCGILVDPQDEKHLSTSCIAIRGRTLGGGPCRASAECATGLCLSTFCFAGCTSAADCRAGFTCRIQRYRIGDAEGTAATCLPARACRSRAGCPAPDETCAPQPNAPLSGLELVCTPGLGKDTGAPCQAASECMSGLCLRGVCIGGCVADAECPRGPGGIMERCLPLDLRVRGVSGTISACLPG